ncbi:MAG: thiamine pyrophosphate-dependent dehydrogenase E1 component subunit alpha [Candidatus Bathyarchaeia archaeon]
MISKDKLIEMYKKMLRIRYFEEKLKELVYAGKTPTSFLHLYIGQEAVAVGVCSNLRKDDYIVSTHRGHGHFIAKGGSLKSIAAEILGRRTGCCKGKGGTMHVADFSIGFLGACGIVGGGFPLAVGAGLSAKLRKTDQVAVYFFSDGASNQGTFHESINLASIWNLPVIFVCENNQYAESTHVSEIIRLKNIADRAMAYGIPGIIVDGNDVLAVYEASKKVIENARAGSGPTLLECKTYRWEGHYTGDPEETYRTKKEVEEWKEKCPIKRFEKLLLEKNILVKNEFEKINFEVKNEVDEAIRFAEESPFPSPEDAYKDVFVSPYY